MQQKQQRWSKIVMNPFTLVVTVDPQFFAVGKNDIF